MAEVLFLFCPTLGFEERVRFIELGQNSVARHTRRHPGKRHEHSFIMSPLVGPLLIGISPGIPCPVAPTALTSLAVNNEQTGFPCAQTLATASVRNRLNSIAIFRMGFTSKAPCLYHASEGFVEAEIYARPSPE